MPFSLVPKERQFFVLFRDAAANLMEALQCLNTFLQSDSSGFQEQARRLRDLEHKGDDITHRIVRELNQTFITPFDRDDIYALASKVDDILDLVEEIADTVVIDRIDEITPEARQMGEILVQMGHELVAAVDLLETRKNVTEHWVRIHELENEGDKLTRSAIGALFQNGQDAVYIIKWKDVYALLEKTIDTAEDVANILESVTIKNA